MSKEQREIDRVWQAIVLLVMETRGDWRRKVATATGIPFTRYRALRRLVRGPVTLRALAESLGTDAPAATVAVNELERRGLVTRSEHPDDRRAKLVSLTPAGRAILRAALSVPDPAPEPLSSLSASDVASLGRMVGSDPAKKSSPRTR